MGFASLCWHDERQTSNRIDDNWDNSYRVIGSYLRVGGYSLRPELTGPITKPCRLQGKEENMTTGYIPKMPTATRYELPDGQKLSYISWAGNWRIVHTDPSMKRQLRDAFVGPIYKTKAELLADLNRYAKEFGF